MRPIFLKSTFIFAFIFFSCKSDDNINILDNDITQNEPNILLIIADDMGLDATPGYNIGSIKPNMPNIENMLNSGIRFNNLWSYPVCTPTRSSIITGKYGYSTGVLNVGDELSASETSLQNYIDNTTGNLYNHAVIGKWHLSSNPNHPTDMGVNYYAGLLNGGVQSYNNWNLTENGQTNSSSEYTTTKFTDLAINWIGNQSQPWFLWLAYNAPHTPFHLPPNELHSQGILPTDQATIDSNPLPYYMAMIEAMDTEIGRLISSMSQEEKDNTVFIFIGDNGSPNQVVQDYNSNRAKGSLYQGGVNVPMIVSGKGVTRINSTEDALINTTDLFATILELVGNNTPEINDSKSFKNLLTTTNENNREYIYTEIRDSGGGFNYTIRNATHKYINFSNGNEAFYNLSNNAFENPNLLNTNQLPLTTENSLIKDELILKLNEIRQ